MPRRTRAEREEWAKVEDWIESLKPEHMHCRVYGHDPRPSSVHTVVLERRRYYEQTLICTHGCGVRWSQLVNMKTGEQLERRPIYTDAPGYLAKGLGVSHGERKNLVRLAEITQRFEALSEDDHESEAS